MGFFFFKVQRVNGQISNPVLTHDTHSILAGGLMKQKKAENPASHVHISLQTVRTVQYCNLRPSLPSSCPLGIMAYIHIDAGANHCNQMHTRSTTWDYLSGSGAMMLGC